MRRASTLALVLALAAIGACAKKAGSTAAPAADAAAEPGTAAGADDGYMMQPESEPDAGGMDELAQYETALGEHEAVLVGAGVGLDDKLATPADTVGGDALQMAEAASSRCERICKIAEAVCDLETKICELGERHAGDARYEKACERAKSDCERASSACDECSET
jgi:hypothetical protein